MLNTNKPGNKISAVVFGCLIAALLLYWAMMLKAYLQVHYADDTWHPAGFVKWLTGLVLLLLLLCLLGWLNYKFPFRKWAAMGHTWPYRSWLVVLLWGFFELLQWRTGHEMETVGENMLVAILLLGFMAVVTLLLDAAHTRQERLALLHQKTAAELDSLRAQLNPHFLFNALNTIYSEALQQGQEKLSQMIGELSGILRFVLHQSQRQQIPIGDEIAFLQKYINLQQARLPDNPQRTIQIAFDWDGVPTHIAPLLLLPFIENAFQYGLHPVKPCSLSIRLKVENLLVSFEARNNAMLPVAHKGAGLGIANVRQRLQGIYPDRHQLQIGQEDGNFTVRLFLNLKNDAG